jgi:hypothetical protein
MTYAGTIEQQMMLENLCEELTGAESHHEYQNGKAYFKLLAQVEEPGYRFMNYQGKLADIIKSQIKNAFDNQEALHWPILLVSANLGIFGSCY